MNWDNIEFRQERKLYTGPCRVKVVAVNPTKDELCALLGLDPERTNDPTYDGRIDVYVKNEEHNITTKIAFFVDGDDVPPAGNGKIKYINQYGRTAYLANPDDTSELDWFSRTGLRPAKNGEEELYAFFINWINIDAEKGKFVLPYEDIANGNIDVFTGALERFGDKEFVGLLGVTKGKYQAMYAKDFGRTFNKKFNKVQWKNHDFTTDFQEYVKPAEPDTMEGEVEFAASGDGGDELPF